MTHPALLLFDIDGTLVMSGRIGSRAVRRAFLDQFGVENSTEGFFFDGKTDPLILRELLESHDLGHRNTPGERAHFFRRYTELLRDERELAPTGHVHPGVHDLLARLDATPASCHGLLTGNIRAGAEIKLGRFDLWHRFPFGAFGDDAENREDLVPIAMQRATACRGLVFPCERVFVIGDSLRDIACARAHGAVAVAVATGNTSYEELAQARPDALFHDLSDVTAVIRALNLP